MQQDRFVKHKFCDSKKTCHIGMGAKELTLTPIHGKKGGEKL